MTDLTQLHALIYSNNQNIFPNYLYKILAKLKSEKGETWNEKREREARAKLQLDFCFAFNQINFCV